MKYNRNVVVVIAVLLIMNCAVGCNIFQRRAVTESYKMSDELLESTRVSMKKLCDEGVFTPEKCAELKVSWELAQKRLIEAGDALKAANRANEAVDDILAIIKSDIRRIQ